MRYKEIWLVETIVDIKKNVNLIKADLNSLQDIGIEYPKLVSAIVKNISKVSGYIDTQLEKIPSGFESVELSETVNINDMNAVINAFNSKLDDMANKCSTVADQVCINLSSIVQGVGVEINELLGFANDKIEKHILGKRITRKGFDFDVAQEEHETDRELIAKVSAKITGSLDAIKDHYDDQPPVVDEEGNWFPAAQRGEPRLDAITDEIDNILQGHLKRYRDEASSSHIELEDVNRVLNQFLEASVEGVIKLLDLLNTGSGNILNHVPEEYNLLNQPGGFIPKLLSLKPSGGGAGAWGPGELGLALLGTPVNKSGTKGDLVVGEEKFELKASAKPKSGGRINTNAVMRGQDGKSDFIKGWREFTNRVKVKQTGDKIKFIDDTYRVDVAKVTGSTSIGYTTIGPTWIGIVNESLARVRFGPDYYGNFRNNENLILHVKKLLLSTLTAPISGEFKGRVNYNLDNIVSLKQYEGEKRNYERPFISNMGFLEEYTKQLLKFYKQTDKVNRILIINPIDSHFEVVSASKPKGLMKKIKAGTVQVGTTYIGFNDPQSRATPQYGTESL